MFACLYLPPLVRAGGAGGASRASGDASRGFPDSPYPPHLPYPPLVSLARDFSPRVETHGARTVTLDISGLDSLLGDAHAIGEQLRRTAADRALAVHVAIAATATATILLATARAGLTVIPPGEEAAALAQLPLSALATIDDRRSTIDDFRHWGLRTLGDLSAIPSADLSARLGQEGLMWQRWARGEDARPLVPAGVEERFEESLDLEWPIEDLEPLSFVLARLCEPLCDRLADRDRGAVVLHMRLALVTKAVHERSLQLPAPMRDARVLRTLALLDLESNPPPAAVDRVTIRVDVTEGRVLQFGLFARALPTERITTLLARLAALMGSDRVGAPALVDSYRPGAFVMAKFEPTANSARNTDRIPNPRLRAPNPERATAGLAEACPQIPRASGGGPSAPVSVIRRFRSPIPARVTLEQGRPVRVVTDRRGVSGGHVARADGPWRSSGEWWVAGLNPSRRSAIVNRQSAIVGAAWNCDEWDVTLTDGASYRISHAYDQSAAWFINGVLD